MSINEGEGGRLLWNTPETRNFPGSDVRAGQWRESRARWVAMGGDGAGNARKRGTEELGEIRRKGRGGRRV